MTGRAAAVPASDRWRCCAGSAPAAPRRPPASAARCAPSRSPSSTRTWSTSTAAALMCTCRPCYLLFTAERRRAALPRRARPLPVLPGLRARRRASGTSWRSRSAWRSSSRNSVLGRTVAFYPGPAGATESELPLGAWERSWRPTRSCARCCPTSRRCSCGRPSAAGRRRSAYLVPIDACYELVGRLRQVWRGFDGGQEARARARRRSSPVWRPAQPAGADEAGRR